VHSFAERLAGVKPLLLDGATGTEIARRGIQTTLPLWSAGALNTHPQVVQQIHEDYLRAGADIITANTFRTHARNVRSSSEARRLTLLAVELAREAVKTVGRSAFVAGSVAPLEDCYSPHLTPHEGYCRREHTEMVQNLVDAGADLCLIETMNTIHEAAAAARAASTLKIPFVVSFVLDERYNLLSGESLADAVEAITPMQPAALMVNCIPTVHMAGALGKLRALTNLPIGAYGNMGTPDDVSGWAFSEDIEPDAYCDFAAEWFRFDARIVGSCCGSSPEHTAALRQFIDEKAKVAESADSE
jgi:homocysteine S-methyltransferase